VAIVLDPRERFAAVARSPDARIDLAECALLVAAEEYPDLDLERYLERLDSLADAVASRIGSARSDDERVAILNRYLFVEHGFAGNQERYDDPCNSFLNDVLDRGRGIPITLAIVYIEVARRLSLPVEGVGFPGHFLAKYAGATRIIIDPFFGRVLTEPQCASRMRAVLGPESEWEPRVYQRAATPREILVRLLTNLKQLYAREHDYGRTLAASERILLLTPDVPLELRDRGLLYEQLDCFAAASADFERFLELAPDDVSASAVRDRLASARRRVGRLH
jgi:regulator of sirC expression with transglutaminase-like and TPR domain